MRIVCTKETPSDCGAVAAHLLPVKDSADRNPVPRVGEFLVYYTLA